MVTLVSSLVLPFAGVSCNSNLLGFISSVGFVATCDDEDFGVLIIGSACVWAVVDSLSSNRESS